MSSFNVGIIQMPVVDDVKVNVATAVAMIGEAAKKGAEIIILPEMFSCPYKTSNFPIYAQSQDGYTYQHLKESAITNNILLIGGSVPELDDGKVYNTCYIFDNTGNLIGKHRKMHLYDINVAGGQYFMESETLTAGDDVTIIQSKYGTFGVGICYDIRFPEYSRILSMLGAKVIFMPAAFNMTTGPIHWELAFRCRALDNQAYVIGAAPARDTSAHYVAYGHSIVTSPWGDIVAQLGEKQGILIANIDISYVDKVREEFPILRHMRNDLYQVNMIEKNIK